MDSKTDYLEARVGEFRPLREHYVRITAEGCVHELDLRLLQRAAPVHRKCWVRWDDEVKDKTFTRLRLRRTFFLADRVTGTVFNEKTGRCSSDSLRLV
jgi:hypothetical protein